MFERPSGGEQVVLVHIDFPDYSANENQQEFITLVESAGASILATITGMRQAPDPKYYVGRGKADEIRAEVLLTDAKLVIFNHDLSPSQERNLEQLCECRVLDRTGLILDIFAQRAQTFEGKLQVELAQLQHLSTRLVRGWTHLERQKGGIGLRGPGETQLETDRRLLRARINTINKRLAKVASQRYQNRQARRRAAIPTISFVGYTNAGKSCLFNTLTGAQAFSADKLFATLDPLIRKIELPGAGSAIVTDTVGFIRHLPHHLVKAFRATLEEVRDANLLCHIIDFSDPNWRENEVAVNDVIQEIGAGKIPQMRVFNKIDLVKDIEVSHTHDAVWLSAKTGAGIDALRKVITQQLYGDPVCRSILLTPKEGRLRAQLYQLDAILSERIDAEGNWLMNIRISQADYEALFGKTENTTEQDDSIS